MYVKARKEFIRCELLRLSDYQSVSLCLLSHGGLESGSHTMRHAPGLVWLMKADTRRVFGGVSVVALDPNPKPQRLPKPSSHTPMALLRVL
jgi:hypothetical protein